jgi:hypothetical protein
VLQPEVEQAAIEKPRGDLDLCQDPLYLLVHVTLRLGPDSPDTARAGRRKKASIPSTGTQRRCGTAT